MKNLIAQFKAMGFKQFAIEHIEKGVFGFAVLLVLIFLGGTSWSRYGRMPEEFLAEVTKGENQIKSSAFTEEKRKELEPKRALMAAVKELHSPIDVSRFDYSTHWFWPMYPQMQKVSEPKWLVPIEPIAAAGKFIMVELPQQPQDTAVVAATDKPKSGTRNSDFDDDLAPRRTKDDIGRGGNIDTTGTTSPVIGGGIPGESSDPRAASGYLADSGYGGGSATTPVNSRGVRYISVRYLVPLERQIEEFMKAMNLDKAKAAELVVFLDFELQRQTAVPGNDPWAGRWETVDIQAALDILERVDFDNELVDLKYTDAVMTMPLPRRGAGAGSWDKTAYHRKLRQLDEEQAAAQRLLMEKAVEAAEQARLSNPFRRKGFAGLQHDARNIRQNTTGGMMTEFSRSVANDYSSSSAPAMPQGYNPEQFGRSVQSFGANEMTKDVRTTTQYLLFRYFDFTVNPGNAYRYRVRLILRNPNFDAPVEELVDEKVAKGETRQTDWSEPTAPVFIADENRIFLSKAERPRADTGLPTAVFEVFQWFADSGMNILAKTDRLHPGQYVAGLRPTEVLRPAQGSFKEEEIPIFTGSVLVDLTLSQIPDLDQTEHADLKVDFRKLKQLASADKALVVDGFGQMMDLDPLQTGDDYARAQRSIDNQGKYWGHLKRAAGQAALDDLDRLQRLSGTSPVVGGEPGYGSAMGGMEGMGAFMGGPNPLKKGAGGKAGRGRSKGPQTTSPLGP